MSFPPENQHSAVILLPYHSDPIEFLCQHLIERFSAQLPDLSGISILMPDTHAAARLRQLLIHKANHAGFPALLGPRIQSLGQYINDSPADDQLTPIPKATRELMLVEALRDHPDLYGKSSPWLLAENLLQLFDELSQQQVMVPDDLNTFTEQVKQAYSIPESEVHRVETQLSHEARLVHTLWLAWQQQLIAENSSDQHQLYIEKLANFKPTTDTQHLFMLGYTRFTPAEQQWFSRLANKNMATLVIQGVQTKVEEQYHPGLAIYNLVHDNEKSLLTCDVQSGAYQEVIDDIYSISDANLAARSSAMASTYPESPLQNILSIHAANNAEQEVLGIELQIRQWLHEGKQHIGVVTQDRRLARRLRALLERTGITLQDTSGWALSTTSAAAALERWLECIEQDFNHLPLLDLLKSAFVYTSIDKQQTLYHIYRLEQDIILHENIASGLYRYRRQISRRADRIDEIWTQTVVDGLNQLLDNVEAAATPLLALQHGQHHPTKFLDALLSSIESIDMITGLSNDTAGQRVLDEINSMRLSLSDRQFNISWFEFRNWLGRTLERFNFVPAANSSSVQLLDLNSSLLCRFDALIIAAADAEHLPGRPAQAAFFNDAVRHSLQLSTAVDHASQLFYHFRCLLHAAPIIQLSYAVENEGNTNLASPWLECLRHYHQIAWGNSLEPAQLVNWLGSQYSGFQKSDDTCQPEMITQYPSTPCDSDLLPIELSASDYQQLVNCPYQFFSSRCLDLKATDEIRMVLEKSDYGSRIHRCLQAFHSDIDNLPGPFTGNINKTNRNSAIQCLMEISDQVFSRDLEDNFQHRGWLQTWQQLIPFYIDWQMAHNHHWQVKTAEQKYLQENDNSFTLKGIIDRTDAANDSIGIIDYKTGVPASQTEINTGEAVQLPFYALLLGETVTRVEYLKLNNEVRTSGLLEDDALQDLVAAQSERLAGLYQQLQNGDPLPAWGDTKTCNYCDMDGLCRRGAWQIPQ